MLLVTARGEEPEMSVAQLLGLQAPEGELYEEACARWPAWVGQDPVLEVGVDLPGLREWCLDAPPARSPPPGLCCGC